MTIKKKHRITEIFIIVNGPTFTAIVTRKGQQKLGYYRDISMNSLALRMLDCMMPSDVFVLLHGLPTITYTFKKRRK